MMPQLVSDSHDFRLSSLWFLRHVSSFAAGLEKYTAPNTCPIFIVIRPVEECQTRHDVQFLSFNPV
jgi:hypothetical protein